MVAIDKERNELFRGTLSHNPLTGGAGIELHAQVRIPTQIDTHSADKSTLVPIEIGTCSDANRHPV